MRPAREPRPSLIPRSERARRADEIPAVLVRGLSEAESSARLPALGPSERFERVAACARQILLDLGLDISDPHLIETHRRVAKMYFEVTTGLREAPPVLTTFPNHDESGAMVVERGIPFFSMCSHHLLPFFGSVHIGYVPGTRLLGLSKFARAVDHVARRPQVQERLTAQVAEMLESALEPRGLAVVVEARHLCMEMRGAETHGASTVTTETRGVLRWPEMQAQLFYAIGSAPATGPARGAAARVVPATAAVLEPAPVAGVAVRLGSAGELVGRGLAAGATGAVAGRAS